MNQEHQQKTIIKADGTPEMYDRQKLMGSLTRAGADGDTAQAISLEIEKGLYSGMTTSELYHRAFRLMREGRHAAAARYSLKRAILEFGPSGFPFEQYLAKVFDALGRETKVGQIIQGACVEHEVDVVIVGDGYTRFVEAKFHNTLGFKTDLKVALYVKARMDDLRQNSAEPDKVRGTLVTNTKFTDKAIQYAECAGVDLLGWDYPDRDNLHDLIERAKVYPITALTTLSRREKGALLNNRIVLCNGIIDRGDALARAGIRGKRADAVFAEAAGLCVPGKGI